MSDKELTGTNQLELKAIAELGGMDFIIKDYQRGYRWTSTEVKTLLDDLDEFVRRTDKKPGEFYCLQPIVVRKIAEGRYEVIDGQQRLTTLNLILRFFSDLIKILYSRFKLFEIEYITRPDSRSFLINIKNPVVKPDAYIDFYFMAQAYQTIKDWFEEQEDDTLQLEILRALLEQKKQDVAGQMVDMANNVRVIWYEVAADEKTSSVDIFTRLNIGKIPLTDAELVKALFLNDKNFSDSDSELKKIHLSTEWNQIEQSLQSDAFWYFLNRSHNPVSYTSRIEFVFDIMSKRTGKSKKYHTFDYFQKRLQEDSVDEIWMEVKQTYQLLKEWFEDRELYHIIGYLLENGYKPGDLIAKWKELPKSKFRNSYLREQVKESIKGIDIADLSYEAKAPVKRILLLFNILTILQKDNSDMRFPFDRFKTEEWDIEHICSQTDRTLEKAGVKQWCDDILEYYLGSSELAGAQERIKNSGEEEALKEDLSALLALRQKEKIDKSEIDTLYKKFQERFKEGGNALTDRDSIVNLTLLDYATNRSYGNAFFPIKRKRIIENDSTGVFVPITTKNLFLKYYSKKINNMMEWTEEDGRAYLENIVEVINDYVNPNSSKL